MSSQFQTPHKLAQVYPAKNLFPRGVSFEGKGVNVLKQDKSPRFSRNLLQANKSSQSFIGHQNEDTQDPWGCVLRRLRVQRGLDPAVVASNVCISVWQLYELETGQDSLFYTPGIRQKAAQRVAALLGSDWTEIVEGRVTVETVSAVGAQAHLQLLRGLIDEPSLPSAQAALPLMPLRADMDFPNNSLSLPPASILLRAADLSGT